jgi:hypothetical protein
MTEFTQEEENAFATKFLLKSLAIAFGCWAAVVAWGVNRITQEMDKISTKQEAFYMEFKNYVTLTESRVTKIEIEMRNEQRMREEHREQH